MSFKHLIAKSAIAVVAIAAVVPARAVDVTAFDNVPTSGFSAFSTSSTPNTFMGDAYNLAPGTTQISGFDLFPVNTSGQNFTGLKVNIFVWGAVNTSGTVNSTTPAFSTLLGSYSFTEIGSYNTGFYFPIQGVPGTTPGFTLPTPLTIPSTQIGLSFNYQGTTDGETFSSFNNLTSAISSNAPSVGSEVFAGYYRNAGSPTETDGDFTSSLRSLGGLGAHQSLAVRIYTDTQSVPEQTGTLGLLGIAAAACLVSRRCKLFGSADGNQ